MNSKLLTYCTAALLTVLLFQNCTRSKFGASGSSSQRQAADSGGQPYDGKPYVFAGQSCSDGTVEARIIYHNSGSATLVKDNCQFLNPAVDLAGGQFTYDGATDTILFSGRAFTVEANAAAKLQPGASFYPQLSGTVNNFTGASVYNIDLFENTQSAITQLKNNGHAVMCSVSVGSLEQWRSDASDFPQAAVGNNVGAPNERFLDIRNTSVRNLMLARLDVAKLKGCDGVDMVYIDSFMNNTGFDLSANIATDYVRFLAAAARDRGLLVGMHNGESIASAVAPMADAVLVEQCYQYNECDLYRPYADAGKAVLITEYSGFSQALCNQAKASGYSLVFANAALDGTVYQPCPQ